MFSTCFAILGTLDNRSSYNKTGWKLPNCRVRKMLRSEDISVYSHLLNHLKTTNVEDFRRYFYLEVSLASLFLCDFSF